MGLASLFFIIAGFIHLRNLPGRPAARYARIGILIVIKKAGMHERTGLRGYYSVFSQTLTCDKINNPLGNVSGMVGHSFKKAGYKYNLSSLSDILRFFNHISQ